MTARNVAARFKTSLNQALSDEEDEDGLPLDEQEQEELITKLRSQNETRNAFFNLAFTCLSSFPSIFHVLRLLSGDFGFFDVLAISSLGMTVYTLRAVPYHSEGRYLSPAQQFIPYLNPVLCCVIILKAWSTRQSMYPYDKEVWILPPIIWIIVSLGRRTMAGIDVNDLERLKYKYKGA